MAGSFSGLLLRHRGRTGLTQRELATRVGVSMRAVQGWEAGVMFPAAGRLQALIVALLEAGGLTSGREQQEAEELWVAVEREAPHAHPPFEQNWFAARLAQRTSAQPAPRAVTPVAGSDARQDWGDAPALVDFVGRTRELSTVREWVLDERCRLVGVLGMGGMGKTSIAARLAHEVAPAFERVYWRGLRNAPPVGEWLAGAIGFLSDQRVVPPEDESNQLAMLLKLMRERTTLCVLDNFETLLEPRQHESRYREGLAGYGSVLRAVSESGHEGCIIVTSREAPPEWTMLSSRFVRTLELGGLAVSDGQVLLAPKELWGDEEEWANLILRYGGNSLALKMVGETIRQTFGGEIGAFLTESSTGAVFGGIRRLLAEQFDRSSPLEQTVLRVLAVEREPVTVAELIGALGPRAGRGALVESIEALYRRSLVERAESAGAAAFTLQAVVLEYVTDELVERAVEDIERDELTSLARWPFVKAQAKDYVRQTQERLIAEPLLQHLKVRHGGQGVEPLLQGLLEAWRNRPRSEQGYGPGNVVNLLRLLRGDLRGLNLAGLALRQAYLAGVEAQDVRLVGADLSEAVLTETFSFPLSVAFSRDAAFLVAGTSAGEVCLWRVADRTPLLVLQAHTGPVHRVAMNHDGTMMASASEDGTVRLFSAPNGESVAVLAGHTSPVYAMALSSDARTLISGSFDGTIRVWDVGSGSVRAMLQADASPVWSVTLDHDARLAASGSFDGTIRIWDVTRQQLLATLDGRSPVWSVRLTEDGSLLASGTEDANVRLWNATTGELRATLQGHTGAVRGVAFSSDGRLVASASWDRTVRLWETDAGQPIAVIEGHTGPVRSVALRTDGRLLASCSLDGSVRLWESPAGRPLGTMAGHTSPVYGVALSADGQLLAGANWDGTVQLWEARAGRKLVRLTGHTSAVYAVALSGDGQIVASGSWDRSIRLWRTESARLLAVLHGHTGGVRSVALSRDGSLLVSGSWDGSVRLWQVPEGRPLLTLRGHTAGVRSVALSADGQLVASGSLDGTVRVWQSRDGSLLGIMEGHNPVYCVALSADGRLVASGSWDGTVRLWDTRSMMLLNTLSDHASEVRSVALSADGRVLASSGFDGTLRLWSVPDGQPLATLLGHTNPVYAVGMSQDGGLLASGSFDGTIRVWDASTGASLHTLRGDRPYERVDITGLSGLTEAQHAALLALGAFERA